MVTALIPWITLPVAAVLSFVAYLASGRGHRKEVKSQNKSTLMSQPSACFLSALSIPKLRHRLPGEQPITGIPICRERLRLADGLIFPLAVGE